MKTALLLFYHDSNKNSFNALLGSLEIKDLLKSLDIYFAKNEKELYLITRQIENKYEKIIVAFSFFTSQKERVKRIIHSLKKLISKNSDKFIIIAGGPHPTGDPFGTLNIGFDYVFVGEGEENFPEFIEKTLNREDPSSIKGIAFKSDEKKDSKETYIFTGKRKNVDINLYPPFSEKLLKFGPIEITRGCPFVCYYCQTPQLFGANVRHRKEDLIVEYVKIMRKNRLRDIRFVSPNAFSYGSKDGRELNMSAIESLFSSIFDAIKPNGRQFIASFPSEVRPEHVNEETISIVKKYGSNNNIILGAQTGSPRLLEKIHRGHTIDDVYNAVDICIKNRIEPHVDFIFGLPGENEEDAEQSILMIKELVKKGAKIHVHRFTPLPQTAFAKEVSSPISKSTRTFIGELTRKGYAYGSIEE